MARKILESFPLGSQWPTFDPFLFCAHHRDHYPAATTDLGPAASLDSHNIGQDFEHPDGWNMYHGTTVPGFPQHPHRGFETVSYVREGIMDHADSLGATARFGTGDVQWLTTGRGVQHSEMFPLLDQQGPNPLELFQIWLNLPAVDKMVEPYFTMLWDKTIPRYRAPGNPEGQVEVVVIAGQLGKVTPPQPPPNSWATREQSDLAIWHIKLGPDATWTMPPTRSGTTRTLYAFGDHGVGLEGELLPARHGARVEGTDRTTLDAGPNGVELMVLQGRSISEPIARYGPFVMNTEAEIHQAFEDYRRTEFGGWPWSSPAPNHGPDRGRFATHANDISEEIPTTT